MQRVLSGLFGLCLIVLSSMAFGGTGQAATNVQDGENGSRGSQSGSARAGQAITGQVVNVQSGGGAWVDARNNTENASAQTGDATARNHASGFTGQKISDMHGATPPGAQPTSVGNSQSGDNRSSLSQSASASTGDGIAGQAIGVVTSGGPSSIVASNTSRNVDVVTGDATASNNATTFTGLQIGDVTNNATALGCPGQCVTSPTAVATLTAANTQTGDNTNSAHQHSNASTGDGVAGQVIGAVTRGGPSSINATNLSENAFVETGSSHATNNGNFSVGENIRDLTNTANATGCPANCSATPTAVATLQASNLQSGDNANRATQSAQASTGDAVAGQVIEAVTSGGSSEIVAANTSRDVTVATGDATSSNYATTFTGLQIGTLTNFAAANGCLGACDATPTAVAALTATNTQTGDNDSSARQAAHATTGRGIAGQVIGATTTGGSSSIDATNLSENAFVDTGSADAANNADSFTGPVIDDLANTASATGCSGPCSLVTANATAALVSANFQDGDNTNSSGQSAVASSGDGVAGQVIGATTSGGSSSIVAANTSREAEVATGNATSSNHSTPSVGPNLSELDNAAIVFACSSSCAGSATPVATVAAANTQIGDNRNSANQAAHASTGDGVAGQVIGAMTSNGWSSVDATNRSDDVMVASGNAVATNNLGAFVGLNISDIDNAAAVIGCSLCAVLGFPFLSTAATNTQTGDNGNVSNQAAEASSGDGVGGQVVGAVARGGKTRVVLWNMTTHATVDSGGTRETNSDSSFVGLTLIGVVLI